MAPGTSRLPLAGVLAAIVFGVGIVSIWKIPGGGDVTEKQFTDFYNSSGQRGSTFLFALVLFVGCWLMQWFFTELQNTLPATTLTQLGRRAATVGTAGVIFGVGIALAPIGVQMNSQQPYVGMPIAHTLAQAGLIVAIMGGFFSFALAIFLLSLQARRSAVAPSWVTITGMVLAVLSVSAYVGLGMFLLPIWALVTALGMRRAPAVAATGATPLGASV